MAENNENVNVEDLNNEETKEQKKEQKEKKNMKHHKHHGKKKNKKVKVIIGLGVTGLVVAAGAIAYYMLQTTDHSHCDENYEEDDVTVVNF